MSEFINLASEFIDQKVYPGVRQRLVPTRVYDQAVEYIGTVNRLVDADTRAATLTSLGLAGGVKLLGKLFGRSIDSHPFLSFHKAHLQALSDAITASDTARNALAALERAATAADRSAEVSAQATALGMDVGKLRARFGFSGGYQVGMADVAEAYRGSGPPTGSSMFAAAGRAATMVGAAVGAAGAASTANAAWQRDVAAAYLRGLQLLAMVRHQWQIAKRGGEEFRKKIDGLTSSSSQMSKVAGYATYQEAQFRELDRHNQGKSTLAFSDPGRYAPARVSQVEAQVKRLGRLCDIAMSGVDPQTKARLMQAI